MGPWRPVAKGPWTFVRHCREELLPLSIGGGLSLHLNADRQEEAANACRELIHAASARLHIGRAFFWNEPATTGSAKRRGGRLGHQPQR
jgi:hypothetical protein